MFNEKIFILLWFWFWILALVSIANILYWLVSLVPYFARFNFVCDNLVIGGTIQKSDRKSAKLHLFVTRLLRPDGILVIRFVNGHIGDLITTELLGFLWGR